MGKQSARLYYDGKDHKDIYFQGNYHRAMYKGDKLVWMKMGGEMYVPTVKRVGEEYGVYLYYPESKSIEKLVCLDGDRILIFNGTFLFTNELEFVSRDGKEFFSEYGDVKMYDMPTIGGCIGGKRGGYGAIYWFFFDNSANIKAEVKIPMPPLTYSAVIPIDYFRDYIFYARSSLSNRNILMVIRKDGYKFPEVTFNGGSILYYAYVNEAHILLVAYNAYLYVYKTRNFSSWTYYGTGIKVNVGNNESAEANIRTGLSCIYDGNKYLLYASSGNGFRKRLVLLYETYNFETFSNIPLPVYITLNGIKENSTRYLVTDEEKFWDNPPEGSQQEINKRVLLFSPESVTSKTTIIYNDGIRMNPQSIFGGGMYIDNLYLQDSENNTIIDFWED